jgi:hypothetical protein
MLVFDFGQKSARGGLKIFITKSIHFPPVYIIFLYPVVEIGEFLCLSFDNLFNKYSLSLPLFYFLISSLLLSVAPLWSERRHGYTRALTLEPGVDNIAAELSLPQ